MPLVMTDRFAPLEQIIADRLVAADAGSSYVATLAAKGLPKVAQKVGEEAVETVIAALTEDDAALVGEAADLLFHLTLLLKLRGLGLDDVAAELARRHGTSGLVEKAARNAE
jgi:phosphoribosyl-ATP pyrophosphohydrolase